MVVLIAGSKLSEYNILSEVTGGLKGLGVLFRIFDLDAERIQDEEALMEATQGTTHTCIFRPGNGRKMSSYYFITGFALGRGERKFLFLGDSPGDLTAFEKQISLGKSTEGLLAFYGEEHRKWNESITVISAKEELAREGIPYTQETLCECAATGNSRCLRLFLAAGFQVDTRNARSVPLLNLACRGGHMETANILLVQGADINAVGNDNGHTALLDAIASGAEDLSEMLILNGASLNIQSKNGQSALIFAASRGFTRLVRLLLDRGADLGLTDKLGMTALKYAELFKHTDILNMMKEVAKNLSF